MVRNQNSGCPGEWEEGAASEGADWNFLGTDGCINLSKLKFQICASAAGK